jgi:hypothetical protein
VLDRSYLVDLLSSRLAGALRKEKSGEDTADVLASVSLRVNECNPITLIEPKRTLLRQTGAGGFGVVPVQCLAWRTASSRVRDGCAGVLLPAVRSIRAQADRIFSGPSRPGCGGTADSFVLVLLSSCFCRHEAVLIRNDPNFRPLPPRITEIGVTMSDGPKPSSGHGLCMFDGEQFRSANVRHTRPVLLHPVLSSEVV